MSSLHASMFFHRRALNSLSIDWLRPIRYPGSEEKADGMLAKANDIS